MLSADVLRFYAKRVRPDIGRHATNAAVEAASLNLPIRRFVKSSATSRILRALPKLSEQNRFKMLA
jgi:hypothetical protein